MRILFAALVALAGCAGDEYDTVCTKAIYDPCTSEHDCTSAQCFNFFPDDLQVCTQTCSASLACPTGGTCDLGSGLCKPPKANDCAIVH